MGKPQYVVRMFWPFPDSPSPAGRFVVSIQSLDVAPGTHREAIGVFDELDPAQRAFDRLRFDSCRTLLELSGDFVDVHLVDRDGAVIATYLNSAP